ncbi:MAG: HIT domain-containing protein [Candidatus Aenigmarchaeota archaeon]|nr:HIT domain-containing protein [Candidatus Aenigmarchaeota archaeon]
MKEIFAPWRIEYVKMEKPEGCIFCDKPKENKDEENYILYRGKHNFIILNNYPYNPGHLMVAPYRHVESLEELSKEERYEHFDMVTKGVEVLKKALSPDGFNLGMNLGEGAGAGIKDHVHTHVVPRWKEDTNYMPVIADTKVLPEALASTYKKLKEAWR